MSKTTDPRISVEGLGLLGSMSDRLVRWINDTGFFAIIYKTGFSLVLAYVACCCEEEVY